MKASPAVPRLLRWLLRAALPDDRRTDLEAEMEALFARRAEKDGRASASVWYLRHAFGFLGVRLRDALARPLRGSAHLLRDLGSDLRHSVRSMVRRPGHAAAIVFTLGLGSGGVVAVFGVANWVLLRPVPGVPSPDDLVTVRLEVRDPMSPAFPVSDPDLVSLEQLIGPLTTLEGATARAADLLAGESGRPERIVAAAVTSGWFALLDLTPQSGRLPPWEGGPTARLVVSDRIARAHLGGPSAAIGSVVQLNGSPWEVAAVAPRGFRGPELPGETDVWLPPHGLTTLDPDVGPGFAASRGDAVWTDLVGRLRPGAGPRDVAAASDAALAHIRDEIGFPHSFAADFVLRAWPGLGLSPLVRADAQRVLFLLSSAGLLLWLLAVANAANLSVTAAVARRPSDAVHAALGASRGRLLQRALVEHGVAGLLGALVAVAIAVSALELFRGSSVTALGAPLRDLVFDHRGAAFAALVAVLAALLAGAAPRVVLSYRSVPGRLLGRSAAGPGTRRIQDALVVGQVALSLTLLLSSGLLLRNAAALTGTSTGFDLETTARFAIDPRLDAPDREEGEIALDRLATRLEDEPSVRHVGFIWPTFVRPAWLTSAWSPEGTDERLLAAQFHTTEGFLPAIGAQLLAGRLHRPDDRRLPGDTEEVVADVIVTESFVAAAFPSLQPSAAVGRTLEHPRGASPGIRIAGVVADVRTISLVEGSPPTVFFPWGHAEPDVVTAWIRADSDPRRALARLELAAAEVTPELSIFDARTGRAQVDRLVVSERVLARLGSSIAALGLLLAGVGIYGLLAFTVESRRREIGIRMALGAGSGRIGQTVIARAMRATLSGLVLGSILAALGARAIASYLHGLGPADPTTWVGGITLLLSASLAAAMVPSLRSTRVDPNEVLRAE